MSKGEISKQNNRTMITFGFNVSNTIPFSKEESFAAANGFDVLQLWFDRNGLSVYDLNGIDAIKNSSVKTILHVLAGLDEFDNVLAQALELARLLEHHDTIVHPIAGNTPAGNHRHALLSAANHWGPVFAEHGIALHFENNSRLEPVLQSVDDVRDLFDGCPKAGFLLDIAHIDNYDHLKNLIEVRMPSFLHVADRHLEQVHEHLAVGQGNIDFGLVFTQYLQEFDGTVIFEVPWDSESRMLSKLVIERICQRGS